MAVEQKSALFLPSSGGTGFGLDQDDAVFPAVIFLDFLLAAVLDDGHALDIRRIQLFEFLFRNLFSVDDIDKIDQIGDTGGAYLDGNRWMGVALSQDFVHPDGSLGGWIDRRNIVRNDRFAYELRAVKFINRLTVDNVIVECVHGSRKRSRFHEAVAGN